VGHCGSTLLSRLLGEIDGLFALREPAVVMGLTRSARRLAEPGFPISPERWAMLRDIALTMLGRTWRESDTALVKATSDAVSLAPALLNVTGEERAVLLYVDLETFLATMLRPHTRRELKLFARDFRVADFRRLVPDAPADAEAYPDGRLAALAWLLHVRLMAAVLDDPVLGTRALALAFDDYLAEPARWLGEMAAFFGCPQPAAAMATLASGEAAAAYAKGPGQRYDAARRARELAAARSAHGAEIDDALAWAGSVAVAAPALAGLVERFIPATARPAPP
jgi:hypothetical protein